MRQCVFKLCLVLMLSVASFSTANAVQVVADSVSENFTPPRHNGACIADVAVTSDGSIAGSGGYCPTPATPSTYEISFDFSVALDERMDSIIIWANSGSIYTDGELRGFDLEVDYVDDLGVPATLVMNGVNIGDTLNANDPKTVTFLDGGVPVELLGVTQVRISNLSGSNTVEMTLRELVGNVETDAPVSNLAVTKTADSTMNVPAGTLITYTYVVTNTGNQPISNISLVDVHNGSGPVPVPSGETLSSDNGVPGDSTDATTNNGTWDILAPFDAVTFTGTYTVTQQDVDTLQ